jgi:tetratricopeptide (TPR) repeat protein
MEIICDTCSLEDRTGDRRVFPGLSADVLRNAVMRECNSAGMRTACALAWQEAYDALAAADDERGLSGEQLERYAEAAWWLGRSDEFRELAGRSYAAHVAEGNRLRAGFVAAAAGRLDRAERQLAGEPEAAEHGYLALAHARESRRDGRLEEALVHARRARGIGERFGSRELTGLAQHDEGRLLLAQGEPAAGLALVEEACAAALSGELGPSATATIHCSTVAVHLDLADLDRAEEWVAMTSRSCEGSRRVSGLCRLHRAKLMRLRGALAEAEREARLAAVELEPCGPRLTGAASAELGEVRRRAGDLDSAEEAFREAQRLGVDPQPGLALLRLVRGDLVGARGTIARALAAAGFDRLARARLLPAEAEIARAAGDVEAARAAARELNELADRYATAGRLAA